MDDGAHFGSENALRDALIEQGSQLGHSLHQMDAVLLIGKALVHFQEGHDALHVPEIVRSRLSLDWNEKSIGSKGAPARKLAKRQSESACSRSARFLPPIFRVGCFGAFL